MCLILFAHLYHPDYPLVVAANRDEFYERPTRAAHFWSCDPNVLAGVDSRAGGTWLGITRSGRFAAITNYREDSAPRTDKQSRGQLTRDFLRTEQAPADYLRRVHRQAADYNGFNLLLGDGRDLFYYSNREHSITELEPGIYGLSNGLLDSPWPKVTGGKDALRAAVDGVPSSTGLLEILADRQTAPECELPDTGVPLEWERQLSPRFIRAGDYGTRASTAIIVQGREVEFTERSFSAGPEEEVDTNTYRFALP
ncbi:NRDE family protein [Exilibacterium tricleocarpae]|uniref:NRDE family protein n=2 Tax=Exilibacterium tricleocarpae TaxID=2591008 RepID=A0A545TKH1_9GAMM|nr:NRDE family protein [Exilibacterium tricleocarpae]